MRKTLLAVFMAGALPVALAGAATWEIDSSHSSAQFKVRHLAVSNVTGGFGKVTGTIEFDESDVTKSSVEATIDATTIDTNHPDRDKHLMSADFFDVENHPTITFKSTKVEKAGEGRLKVTGDLTMRGVTKPVVLDVEGPLAPITDQRGNMKTGASANAKIDRTEFGVAWSKVMEGGGLVVGNEVSIMIEVELVHRKQQQ